MTPGSVARKFSTPLLTAGPASVAGGRANTGGNRLSYSPALAFHQPARVDLTVTARSVASASLKEYGGLKGAWNWLLGRGLPAGKELYSKMVDEADDMIMAMEEGREVDILQEVMKYSGLEAGEH